MRENSILIHLIFIYFNCLPDDVLCKFAIWACDTENENVFILMNIYWKCTMKSNFSMFIHCNQFQFCV